MTARRITNQCNSIGITLVLSRVLLHPANGAGVDAVTIAGIDIVQAQDRGLPASHLQNIVELVARAAAPGRLLLAR